MIYLAILFSCLFVLLLLLGVVASHAIRSLSDAQRVRFHD